MTFKTASLTEQIKTVVLNKGTEHCHSGIYNKYPDTGTYLCRQCGISLFKSKNKFDSYSGWPSFDQAIQNHVDKVIDSDGIRIEVLCQKCRAHLGHVFYNEGFTQHQTRYCINSLALDFIAYDDVVDTEEAIVAAGCFWGVEYLFKKLKGVLKTEAGYTGGHIKNPNYELICQKHTGHVEAVRIIYDPNIVNYCQIVEHFFEIHDFTQDNGQGGDIGEQYLSKIFYYDQKQRTYALNIIDVLNDKGFKVATSLESVQPFWKAENYHQSYYQKNGQQPYCHTWTKIF